MINLLPPDHAASIRYARQNTVLRLWLIGMAAAILGMLLILGGGWIYMNQQTKGLQKNIAVTNNQLKVENLSKVQAEAKEITGDVNVINKVLSQEIDFASLIQSVGSIMPPGTVLDSLSLSNKVSGAIDLSASTKDYPGAAQIAVNLSDPNNKLFSKVDIVSVGCKINPTKVYICAATYRALFTKTAQAQFLTVPQGDKQ